MSLRSKRFGVKKNTTGYNADFVGSIRNREEGRERTKAVVVSSVIAGYIFDISYSFHYFKPITYLNLKAFVALLVVRRVIT